MTAETILDCIRLLNPGAVDRGTRLAFALNLLERGVGPRDAARRVRAQFGCSRMECWRLVRQADAIRITPEDVKT